MGIHQNEKAISPLVLKSECRSPSQDECKGTPDPKQESGQGEQRPARVKDSEQGLAGREGCGWALEEQRGDLRETVI